MINVAWAITRHHNLGQAAKIMEAESRELDKAGLKETSQELLRLAGKVMVTRYDLERIYLVLPGREEMMTTAEVWDRVREEMDKGGDV